VQARKSVVSMGTGLFLYISLLIEGVFFASIFILQQSKVAVFWRKKPNQGGKDTW
jgi:hypothetical protein